MPASASCMRADKVAYASQWARLRSPTRRVHNGLDSGSSTAAMPAASPAGGSITMPRSTSTVGAIVATASCGRYAET